MSALFTVGTTGTGTGAVTSMHDSLTPLGGLVPMFNILAGCIWPGGVGAGLYGFLVVAIIAVFVAGLMVGRTPEYLGKKIEVREMKLAMLAVLIYPLVVLGFSGASVLLQTALDSLGNSGPHGLSEIIYAYASTNANNGSAFAGLNGNTLWFNTTLGLAMLLGRFAYVVPVLALAGASGGEEENPGVGGHVPDRRSAVRRPVGRRDRHPLPPAIFPRPLARAGRRALPDAQRQDVLIGDRPMSSKAKSQGLFDGTIIAAAAIDALRKLDPRALAKNPVIFVTEAVSLMVTLFFIRDLVTGNGSAVFSGQIAAWLWFTVLFANFAEAVAEGRGKAQADALRRTRSDTRAKRYIDPENLAGVVEGVNALDLRLGDIVLVEAGEIIPGDGDIVEGVASVNESAITGESAPVIREAGGDRSAVTGGTTVLSDFIKVKITAAPGSTFIDRMIALVEGAERQKTPNELALSILLSGLTIIFLIVCVTLWPIARYSGADLSRDGADRAARMSHSDDDRRPAVGHRHRRHGSAGPLQRHRDLRPRGRGGGRRRHAAARQDRHDHVRQSHGDGVSAGATAFRPRTSPPPRLPRALPTRRPKAARSSRSPRAISASPNRSSIRARHDRRSLHRPNAHFGRRRRRPVDPQGRDRFDPPLPRSCRSNGRRSSFVRRSSGSRCRAARRWPSPTTAGCWASSI